MQRVKIYLFIYLIYFFGGDVVEETNTQTFHSWENLFL